ncbi:DUF4129 domain-containing protein [Streptomyces sp. NBC_01092]|uniref:DUF4129 domain-containing protein n=1 Tax=Streptomyces sp. NBC_01092 TaxID=2903748 RepID=UPI00386C893F|nr:DUF4129 domain-containing protein [Streptomyces sp. NBC_01092]
MAGVAAGVVGTLAVAAIVLRPAEGLLHSGKGPLGQWGIVAIGLSVAWTVGAIFVTRRLRHRIGADRTALPPGEERLRQAAVPLLVAGPGVIGVLALVLHRFDHRSTPPAPPEGPLPSSQPSVPNKETSGGSSGHEWALPPYLLLGLLAAVVVVIIAVAVVPRLRRHGLRVPPHLDPAGAPAETEDEDAHLLLSAVHSGRRALVDAGDARAAVIACYAAMEDALAASGVQRRASDSPADLLTRAVDAGLAPTAAAPRLTALFREARYSSHPMDATHREAAAEALETIASLLQDRESAR